MGTNYNKQTLGSGFASTAQLQDAEDQTETSFADTLSRTASGSGSNAMQADLDMNSNSVLNASTVSASQFLLDGSAITTSTPIQSAISITTESFTATAGQTLFSLGTTYVVGADTLGVYLNGIRMIVGTDYTETSSSSITFLLPLTAGDQVFCNIGSTVTDATVYDALNATYTAPYTGTTQTTIRAKLGESVSVVDFGAVGDGSTDDSTAFQAAVDAVSTAGGGIVFVPRGTYVANFTLKSLVVIKGEGINATVIKKADSSTTPAIISEDFATLTGTNAWYVVADSVPYGMGVHDLTIDGNTSGSATGNGISLYAKGYQISKVLIRDCAGVGFYSECGNVVGQVDYKDTPEAKIIDLQTRDNGSHGIQFRGSHDAIFDRIISNANTGTGFLSEFSSGVYDGHCNVRYVHTYNNTGGGIDIQHTAYCGMLFADGEDVIISGDSCMVDTVRCLASTASGLTVSGANNNISNVKVNLDAASTGTALTVSGLNNRLGNVYLSGGNGTNTGADIDANNCAIADLYVADVGGDALKLGTTTARSSTKVDGFVTNCTNGFNYVNQGARNRINLATFTGAGQTAVTGALPSTTDRIEIVSQGVATYKTFGNYEASFAIDSTGVKSVVITHDQPYTPTIAQVQASIKKASGVTDFVIDFVRIAAVTSTTVTVEIKVGTASATGSTTAIALVQIDTSRA